MSALWSLAAAMSLAGSPVGSRIPAGIPSTHAPQVWGAAVLETLQSNPRLEPIRAEDIAGASSVPIGASHATAVAPSRAKLEATYSTPAQSVAPFVRREIDHVWRLSTPATAQAMAMRVTTSVESLRGEPGRLTLVGHDEISIPVVLLESAPMPRTDNSGTRVLEGGVVLQIPSGALLHSGQYGGRLILRTEGY
ncbi:MAG TPA: hypothetical protein VN599_02065 [Rudaea sp.]|nr:hypothetical protein [Rudaea sp.]